MRQKTGSRARSTAYRLSVLCGLTCLAWLVSSFPWADAQVGEASRPNFLILVADDMGWSDMGAFGGEIHTPSLDALAGQGLSMTQFYVAPTCSPTRAMLLTGLDNHAAGVGTMHEVQAPNQLDSVNYGAQLHDGVVTVAEVLKQQGYETFMTGKWHLSVDETQRPHRRGFDRTFVLIQGGASHFGDALPVHQGIPVEYLEDGRAVGLPDDFYSSIFYTDKMLDYLETRNRNAPFFAYLAYTAPHDPLQVPDEWLNRYKGTVGEGGIRSPLIVRGPGIPANRITDRIGHVMDITPSIFSIVGIEPEDLSAYAGKALPQGESLLSVWQQEGRPSARSIAFELFGNKAVRSGGWKVHHTCLS